jgi:hypothetical protein
MIVPQYWAEGRLQHRDKSRQVTVRRFGWSDVSQADAQANADARAQAALARLVAGEKIPRREPKIPYNGAAGVPIREEIVARQGETIITRNAYGARCLNTPNVLFADIDFQDRPGMRLIGAVFALLLLAAVAIGWTLHSKWYGIGAAVLAVIVGYGISKRLNSLALQAKGGVEGAVRGRIATFIAAHPDWHLRLYRTPAGMRVLAMHRTFDPAEPAVADCFRALGADPIYARMCLNQHCFRARVSPKPWRIGIAAHMRPSPGVWPVNPERLPDRNRWIEAYEHAARDYASCRFVEDVGSGAVAPEAQAVQVLHDELCQATGAAPIA